MTIKTLSLDELQSLKGVVFDIMSYCDSIMSTHRNVNTQSIEASLADKAYKAMLNERNKYSRFYNLVVNEIKERLKDFDEWRD